MGDAATSSTLSTAFFYGTLIAPAVLSRVLFGPSHASATSTTRRPLHTPRPALLRGYERRRVRHADYPGIIPHEGGEVKGVLVAGLTQGDVFRLDVFEGDQYARREVDVLLADGRGGDGETVRALAYVWTADLRELEAREWDYEEFRREKLWRWAGDGGEAEGEYRGAFALCSTPFGSDGCQALVHFVVLTCLLLDLDGAENGQGG